MIKIRVTALVALLALVLPGVGELHAQDRERGIQWRAVGEVGSYIPLRSLGKNQSDVPELRNEQVSSEANGAMLVGGGVEAYLVDHEVRLRAMYRTTLDASADGQRALCNADKIFTDLPCFERESELQVQWLEAEVHFVQGTPDDWFRPTLNLGLGLRFWEFGGIDSCPGGTLSDPETVTCVLLRELWGRSSQTQPTLRFGFGGQVYAGPFRVDLAVNDLVSPYDAGVGASEGELQNDASISLLLSIRVR